MSQAYDPVVPGTDTAASAWDKYNTTIAALRSNHSGGSAPSSTEAFMLWLDTSTTPDSLKMRNAGDSAWVDVLEDVTATGGGLARVAAGAFTTAEVTSAIAATSANALTRKNEVDARVLSIVVQLGTISASDNKYLFSVPANATIIQVAIVSETGVASDPSDKWDFQVANLTAAVDLLSTAKTTDGAAITADTTYDLDPDQNLTPTANDVLQLQMTKGGSAANLTEAIAVVEYKVPT